MQVKVIGAGPVGSVAALLLARSGHQVTIVDRDPGPSGADWQRRGIFQFALPHAYRTPAVAHLQRELPDVWRALLRAGGVPISVPGGPSQAVGLLCRREAFDTVLWRAVHDEPGIESITGHADRVLVDRSRVTGVEVDGRPVTADLVVDASGRGHLSVPLRGTPEGGSCGLSYIARLYRLRDGAEPGPRNTPIGYAISRPGYQQIVFQHDNGYFNVLLVRATSDKDLAELRHESRWNAAIGLFAGAGAWIDPERAEPAGPVRAGAGLTNTYLGQPVGLTGLLAIGDAVATTNPTGGRGVSLGISSAETMTRIVANSPRECWATELDAWCEENLRRWVTDQIEMDAALLRRWAGEPFDPSADQPVDLMHAALSSDPENGPALMPYNMLAATSASFDHLRCRAREIVADGWRPVENPDGPTHDSLRRLARSSARYSSLGV